MLQIFRFVFAFAGITEISLYFWNGYEPEVMITDTWSIQEIRLAIALLSALAFAFVSLWKEEA